MVIMSSIARSVIFSCILRSVIFSSIIRSVHVPVLAAHSLSNVQVQKDEQAEKVFECVEWILNLISNIVIP